MNQLAGLNATHQGRTALRSVRGLGLFGIALGNASRTLGSLCTRARREG